VAVAADADTIWSVCSNGWLWRIWPAGPRVEGVAQLGWRARAIAVAGQSLWVLREGGQLARLDPSTGEVVSETKVPGGARRMIATDGALWLTCKRGRRVVRVDCESGLPDADIAFPRRAVSLAVAGERLFIGCAKRLSPRLGWLYEIDRESPSLGPAIELPDQPRAIAAGLGGIWLACSHSRRKGTIERLDPRTGKLES
jgi:streptogramin lyase